MIRASDLLGCAVRTDSGERLGRVHDLRAVAAGDGTWELAGLIVGRAGMLARLSGRSGREPLVIPWRAVTGLREGLVVVADGRRE